MRRDATLREGRPYLFLANDGEVQRPDASKDHKQGTVSSSLPVG